MIVYRIARSKYVSDLSGTGAARTGGRWNKKGSPVLYTGESKEIALLEAIVHTPPVLVPDYSIVSLEIPDNSIIEKTASELPVNWMNYPAPIILSEIAEQWIEEGKSIALKVPSCIIHTAHNYILNCRHPDYYTIKLIAKDEFYFDPRLVK